MKIRSANNRDVDSIKNLIFEVLIEYGLKPDPNGTDADLNDIETHYINRGGVFEVVEQEDGQIIGTAALYPKDNGVCELRKMYLSRATRGKGLGRQLMERFLEHARQRGFHRMELDTASALVEAIQMYQRFGFRQAEPEHPLPSRCNKFYILDL